MQDVDTLATGQDAGHQAPLALTPRAAERARQVLDLRGESTPVGQLLRETWQARDLIATLARKDFFVRYRRASLGVLWAVGLPLIQAVVLAEVFTHFRAIRAGVQVPMPVYVITGMTAYSFFTSTVLAASTSIVDGAGLSSKIYFPRVVLPLVSVRANLYSFVCSLGIVIAMALGFRVSLDEHLLLLVPAVLLLIWLTSAAGLALSAMHVYFRDIRYIVQALFSALLYLTPVFLPLHIYPPTLRRIVLANPVTGLVEVFRLAIGAADPQWRVAVLISLGWASVLSVVALFLHCRRNRVFVDLM